jgi:hypothetical protein
MALHHSTSIIESVVFFSKVKTSLESFSRRPKPIVGAGKAPVHRRGSLWWQAVSYSVVLRSLPCAHRKSIYNQDGSSERKKGEGVSRGRHDDGAKS